MEACGSRHRSLRSQSERAPHTVLSFPARSQQPAYRVAGLTWEGV